MTFDVPPATILHVIGPSGSGKTTLVPILTGKLKATAGSVQVLGEDPQRFRRKTRAQLGYMPQLFVMYPDLTAAENVSFVGSLFGLLWRRRRRRVRQVLELVQLWDVRNRRAGQLSGGMQRRLELACALVHEPTLIFMDEPTAGQDPILRQTIWSTLSKRAGAKPAFVRLTLAMRNSSHAAQSSFTDCCHELIHSYGFDSITRSHGWTRSQPNRIALNIELASTRPLRRRC